MNYRFRPIDVWPREKIAGAKRAQFRSGYTRTLELLDRELGLLSAENIVFQIDIPESQIRQDGLPYSKARPTYQGVIISFESKFGPLKYLTDTFDDWQDNLRGIPLGLEALRKVDRYGVTKRGEQYTGWRQLPAVSEAKAAAASLIAFLGEADKDEVMNNKDVALRAYRIAVKKVHPDKEGGDQEQFERVMEAKKLLAI